MSQFGSQPATAGQTAVPPIPGQSTAASSTTRPSVPADANHADSAAAAAATSQQPSELDAGAPPAPPQEKRETLGRSAKRSLTNLRRRDRSTASKRSTQQQNEPNEKESRPLSSDRTGASSSPRPKKRSGILAILNCCSAPEDAGQAENAQPAKPPARTPPTRVQQPPQMRQQQQSNVAVFDPSADESKEVVVNEKMGQQSYPDGSVSGQNALPAREGEKPPQGDATVDKPVPPLPTEAPSMRDNADSRPLQDGRQRLAAEGSGTGAGHGDAAVAGAAIAVAAGTAASAVTADEILAHKPQQPPPPASTSNAAQSEDEMILDRTPEQAARDHDIEMSDAGPSIPLTGQDAAVVVEEEKQAHEQHQREAGALKQDELPPPPPLPQTTSHDTTAASQATSMVSTPEPPQKWLLPPIRPELRGKKCLVLDLDETLVHSSFKILHQADFTIPVEIEGQYHNVYVIKRPGVDTFLKRVGELYEVVVFTASVSKYGDPVLDNLDIHHVVHHRLFRESCYNHQGNYVKDLSQIGRDLRETIIIDNSPTSYIFHPQHAVPVSSWFSDAHDNELLDLIPVLEDLAGSQVADVSLVLDVAL